ncbi:Far upstream element-binding protein 3-like [Globisporangium polare]
MKAEADRATANDARQATHSRSPPRMRQTGGSLLGDRLTSAGDKAQARALLDRVRAIRDEPPHHHHSHEPTDPVYASEDRAANAGGYERPRWQASSSSGGGSPLAHEYIQPPSYSAQSSRRHGTTQQDNHYHRDFQNRPSNHHHQSYARRAGNDDDAVRDTPDQYSHEIKYREAHHHGRRADGYEEADIRRAREYINATTKPVYHDRQSHRYNQVSPARGGDYRPRPTYGYGHGAPGPSGVPPAFAYPPVAPVSRREGTWNGEASPREGDQYSCRSPVVTTGAAYPPPLSYAPPLLENLPGRRVFNPPASPASYHPRQRPNASDDNRRPRHREECDERVVVRHDVRSPPRLKPRRAVHEASSYQSTSNSSALSPGSFEEDVHSEALEYRDDSNDDEGSGDEDDDDEDEDVDYVDAISDPQRHALRLSRLSPEMYEDNELHSDFRHAVHMIIPSNSFGCLIGNGGAIIRKINKQTRCTLSIRDPDAFSVKGDRVLRIYGKPKGICLAQHLVIEKIRAHRAKKQDPNYMPLFHGCDGSDFLLLPSLPDSSITRSMNDAVAVLASAQNQRRGNKESMDGPVGSLKWLVPSDNVGKIMGTGGEILAGIGRETNTKIHITPTQEMPRGSKERKVAIFGAPENIELARQRIEKKAGGRAHTYNDKCGQYFAIPHTSAGALIGVKGSVARRITEQSGARLQIPYHDHLPLGSVNRTVHIQGTKQQVEAAYTLVCSTVRADLAAVKSSGEPISGTYLVVKIIVTSRIAHFLLEQHGRLIREIVDKSGAHAL